MNSIGASHYHWVQEINKILEYLTTSECEHAYLTLKQMFPVSAREEFTKLKAAQEARMKEFKCTGKFTDTLNEKFSITVCGAGGGKED